MNIDLPEVPAIQQAARFYRQDDRDFVEISFVGQKDTIIRKVQPEHMARFRDEWDAYCDGVPPKQRAGTPLTDIPGVSEQIAQHYVSRNVHNAEELAALSDAQCQGLGHGTLTRRKAAHDLLLLQAMKQKERSRDLLTKASATVNNVPAEAYASASDLAAVKSDMADIKSMLVELMQKPKRGRPPKE